MRKRSEIVLIMALLVFVSKQVYPQHNISGRVIESHSNVPISFVNIAILDTNLGTISNAEGNYRITIPDNFRGKHLIFSCIGYKSDTIAIPQKQKKIIVKLEKKATEIAEVIVMPENTLKKLLQKAWDRIPENYPVDHTNYKGFYRETVKNEQGKYISFGEALVETVRGSVKLQNDQGQIKILNSRGGYLPGRDSTTSLRFYGGIFSTTSDFVQSRAGFISPSKFNDYKYTVQKTGNSYKINFRKKNEKHGINGYFMLDTLDLSYTEAKYNQFLNENEITYKRLDAEMLCKFIKIGDKYFLKYKNSSVTGYDKLKKKRMYHFKEYLATEIRPGYEKLIPEDEQIKYFDIFMDKIPDYSDTFWNGNTIIEADSLLKNNQLAQNKMAFITANTRKQKKKEKRQQTLLKIYSKLSFRLGATYSLSEIPRGEYLIAIPSLTTQPFNKNIENPANLSLNGSFGYYFTNSLAIRFSAEDYLTKNNRYKDRVLGLEFRKRINRFGKPHNAFFNAGFGKSTSLIEIGALNNSGTIEWGNKKLNAEKIEVYAGAQSWIFKPSIGFSRFLNGKSALYVNLSYNLPISSTEKIALKEKKVLFRKTGFKAIEDLSMTISRNNVETEQFSVKQPPFMLTLGINFLN